MANATVVTPGQVNQAGDLRALFYKEFTGEVFTAFSDQNVMDGKQMRRDIKSGKSAGFNAIGKVGSGYHTAGSEIIGQNVNHNEVIIEVDGLLYSDVFIPNLDEAMNHYDVRAPYSSEMGAELALQYDANSLRSVIMAARSAAIVTDGNGGTVLDHANMGTDGTAIADAFWAAAQALDEKNVFDTRYGILKPAQYYLVARNKDLLNADWGGRGSYAEADLPVIAGVGITKCNHLPTADDTLNTGIHTKYRQDFSKTRGAIFTQKAAGVVHLLDLNLEAQYDIRRQGTLMVAKMAVGHGSLRPDCAVELKIT